MTSMLSEYYGTGIFKEENKDPFNSNANIDYESMKAFYSNIISNTEEAKSDLNQYNVGDSINQALTLKLGDYTNLEELKNTIRKRLEQFGQIKEIVFESSNGKSKTKAYVYYERNSSVLSAFDFFRKVITQKDKENVAPNLKEEENDPNKTKDVSRDCPTAKKNILPDDDELLNLPLIDVAIEDLNTYVSPESKKKSYIDEKDIISAQSYYPKQQFFKNMNPLIPFTAKPIPISPTQEKLFKAIQKRNQQLQQFSPFNQTNIKSNLNIPNFQSKENYNMNPMVPGFLLISPNPSSIFANRLYIPAMGGNMRYPKYYTKQNNPNFYNRNAFNKYELQGSKKYDFKTTSNFKQYSSKYVCNYLIQIEDDPIFKVRRKILGNNGINLKRIIYNACNEEHDFSTKVRLRGKGSKYLETPENTESDDPLQLCISSLNYNSYIKCCSMIEEMLLKLYADYYVFYTYKYGDKEKDNLPSEIRKYEFIVQRDTEEETVDSNVELK